MPRTALFLSELFAQVLQFLPNFYHSVGIQLAIFQQVFACNFLLAWGHVFDERKNRHCFRTVVHAFEFVVVKFAIVREHSRQNALYREGIADVFIVIVSVVERVDKVHDICVNIHKVFR